MNEMEYQILVDELVQFLNKLKPNWNFYGSVSSGAETKILIKLNYNSPMGIVGTMYFNENHTTKDVINKIEMMEQYVTGTNN